MVFLGLLFDRNEEAQIAAKSRGGFVQNQVNAFQWNCIDGLYENGVNNLHIVNCLPVGTFPRAYRDMIIPSKAWSYRGGTHDQIGSINLPVLKQWGRYRACRKMLKRLKDKDIVIYSPYQPFMKAVKRLDQSYRITLIVPDLPSHYDYAKTGKLKKVLRSLNNRSIDKCMARVDRFVLLTDAMKEPLGVGSRPYTVVEGICAAQAPEHAHSQTSDKKSILYAGSLNQCFGIDVLMQAFRQIKGDDYELWICGGGDYQDTVKSMAELDSRIKFFGYVPKEKVAELQAQAAVLVNPRQNTEEYTKYSFPSKTMEYLLSGVPVVAYKLDGIPDEYDPYFCYPADNTPYALAQALMSVCEDSCGQYELIAKQAMEFAMREKNPKKQAEKILQLIGFDKQSV